MNDKGVCKTAPDKPGLLNILINIFNRTGVAEAVLQTALSLSE